MWFFYTGFAPRSFVSEGSVLYMNDNNTDICRKFDDVLTDVSVGTSRTTSPEQSFALKEIDLSDIFSLKALQQVYFSFENYTQSVYVDAYMAKNHSNGRKARNVISVIEIPLDPVPLGTGTIGLNTF